jgi:hypothetical protein
LGKHWLELRRIGYGTHTALPGVRRVDFPSPPEEPCRLFHYVQGHHFNLKTVGRNRGPGLIFPVLHLESYSLSKNILFEETYFLLTVKILYLS